MNNSWEKYEIHIIQSLERLEKRQQELHEFIQEHMEKEEARIEELNLRFSKLENDSKWATRIGMAIWGIIVTGVNVWINPK